MRTFELYLRKRGMTSKEKEHIERATEVFLAGLTDSEILNFLLNGEDLVKTVLNHDMEICDKFLGLASVPENLTEMSNEVYRAIKTNG